MLQAWLLHLRLGQRLKERSMHKRISFVLAGSLGAVGLVMGCDDSKSTSRTAGERVEGAVKNAGQEMKDGAKKAGDVLADGAKSVAPKIGNAVDQTADAARRVGVKLADAIDATALESEQIRDTL